MMGNVVQRHHSISDFDPNRSHSSSNLQNFYASQRYQSRPTEAEQMMQAKRRMAAQRERELRNYHQEQQYNRSMYDNEPSTSQSLIVPEGVVAEMSSSKSDRSMSPASMSEEGRRELIARQHRALYGNDSATFYPNHGIGNDTSRPETQSSNVPTSAGGARGPSPSTQGNQAGSTVDTNQQRSRADSSASPNSATQTSANATSNPAGFSLFDSAAQQSSHTSTSSPGESPSRPAQKSATAPIGTSVAPIGTRPSQPTGSQAPNPVLNKRSTTPLPSPLSFGFASNESANNNNERSTSAASNPSAPAKESSVGLGWGNGSGVWGNKPLGVQASVWG
jgi:hypothetical protein